MNTEDKADAQQLIRELKAINAFGNAALDIDAKHEWAPRWVERQPTWRETIPGYFTCSICRKGKDKH